MRFGARQHCWVNFVWTYTHKSWVCVSACVCVCATSLSLMALVPLVFSGRATFGMASAGDDTFNGGLNTGISASGGRTLLNCCWETELSRVHFSFFRAGCQSVSLSLSLSPSVCTVLVESPPTFVSPGTSIFSLYVCDGIRQFNKKEIRWTDFWGPLFVLCCFCNTHTSCLG